MTDRINWTEEMVSRLMKGYQGLRKAGWSHTAAAHATVHGSIAGRGTRAEFLRRVADIRGQRDLVQALTVRLTTCPLDSFHAVKLALDDAKSKLAMLEAQ